MSSGPLGQRHLAATDPVAGNGRPTGLLPGAPDTFVIALWGLVLVVGVRATRNSTGRVASPFNKPTLVQLPKVATSHPL